MLLSILFFYFTILKCFLPHTLMNPPWGVHAWSELHLDFPLCSSGSCTSSQHLCISAQLRLKVHSLLIFILKMFSRYLSQIISLFSLSRSSKKSFYTSVSILELLVSHRNPPMLARCHKIELLASFLSWQGTGIQ